LFHSDQFFQQLHCCSFNYHIRSFTQFRQVVAGYYTSCTITAPHIFLKNFFSHIFLICIKWACVSRNLSFTHFHIVAPIYTKLSMTAEKVPDTLRRPN
jgi:hypothetical protein